MAAPKPTQNVECIAEMAELKCDSDEDEESDEHYKAEHYLIRSKTVSKNDFAAIDVIQKQDIVRLKEHIKQHPRNASIKHAYLTHLRTHKYRNWLCELKS